MKTLLISLSLLLLSLVSVLSLAQQSRENIQIKSTPLGHGLYMFRGAGGNVAVSVGEDGVLIVDDQYADMTAKIDAEIAKLTDAPIDYVLNTHWHWDHTGGNENYGRDGKTIIAHENTYVRMSTDQHIKAVNFEHHQPASPKEALPVITYNDVATVRFNGITIRMLHVPNAHTDTDALVYFTEANVLHSGDVYIRDSYPFIDTSTGGSLNGVIAGLERLVAVADDETKIVPGHGSLAAKQDVMKTLAMLKGMRAITQEAIDQGKSLDQFLESNPSADYDGYFQKAEGQGKSFAHTLYKDLKGQ